MNKILHRSIGKAAQIAGWTCDLYKGCSAGCEYCRLKLLTPSPMEGWGSTERLLDAFREKLLKNETDIQKGGGVLFSWTTDACLLAPKNTFLATYLCVMECIFGKNHAPVPCTIVTKNTDWLYTAEGLTLVTKASEYLRVMFSFSGFDEKEAACASLKDRLLAIRNCRHLGCQTGVLLDPILDEIKSASVAHDVASMTDYLYLGTNLTKEKNLPVLRRVLEDVLCPISML